MAPALSLPLPWRLATAATALAWLCAAPAAAATEGQASAGECSALGGVCEEEEVERAEDELALGMRTELLQQEARLYRASQRAEKPSPEVGQRAAPLQQDEDVLLVEALASGNPTLSHSKHRESQMQHAHGSANYTVTASSFNDSELSQLVHAEQNLTNYVHQQAEVVSKSTDVLSRALVKVKVSAEHGADLERRFDHARAQAEAAKSRLEGFLLALRSLKKRRDGLQNETVLVQRQLDQLAHQYGEVVRQYRELLMKLPDEQGLNYTASESVRTASQQLSDAGVAQGSAQAAVKSESYELQEAIGKLNTLNAELRSLEGRVTTRYEKIYSAASGSRWSLPLVLLAGAVAALRVAAS